MSNLPIKRFRIVHTTGPEGIGPLNQYYSLCFRLELDPGDSYCHEEGTAFVMIPEMTASYLGEDDVRREPARSRATRRLVHFVGERLRSALASPQAPRCQLLEPTAAELEMLRRVDPVKVAQDKWLDVEPIAMNRSRRVFISCGQQTPAEIALGKRMAQLVAENTGLEGYFAEYQQSLEGVTGNIFNAIRSSAAFIAVMHRRDALPKGEFRGSVWIEQEIAISAFLAQSLGAAPPARVYIQHGIRREGVRGFILLNPREFETDEEILRDLEAWWPFLKKVAQ